MTDAVAGFETIYSDASLVVLNKPAGLLSVPGKGELKQDCLSARVQQVYPSARVIHRLDMATSGLMLMALDARTHATLSRSFEAREIYKRYIAVVDGDLSGSQTTTAWQLIQLPIAVDWPNRPLRIIQPDGKPSQTRWRVLGHDPAENTTRLELEPITGRSHQLRVHLKALGHPILGDALYAPSAVAAKVPRLLLHACSLRFAHPANDKEMIFEHPAPF